MLKDEVILQEAKDLHDYVLGLRREMHQIAEVSGKEWDTRARIEEELKADGIPFVELEGTSILATIETGKPGPKILLRTDMDALPMPEEESNLKNARVCISRTPKESAHMCGHDSHMAMCLGACKALVAHKDELIGTIDIIFESGEEIGVGIPIIMDYFEKENKQYDAVWGIHVYAGMPSGKLSVQGGPRMAGYGQVDITFHGRGGHGSRPDQSINPVYCATNFMNNIAVAFANQIDANETVTLGITGIIGGTAANIIPDDAHVIGSMRYFSLEEGRKALRIEREVAEHTAAMHKCTVTFGPGVDEEKAGIPVVNDEALGELAEQAIGSILPEGMVTKWEPWFASESFSRYLQKWPGVLCHLGILNEEYGSGAAHHNGFFDVDEGVMDTGTIATLKFVSAVMENYGK